MFYLFIIVFFVGIVIGCMYKLLLWLNSLRRSKMGSRETELQNSEKYGTKSLQRVVEELNTPNGNPGKVILLDGAWGSGKTWVWNEYIKPRLKSKRIIYISLFGKNDVHADVFEQVMDKLPGLRIGTLKTKFGYFILSWVIVTILIFIGIHALPNDLPPENLLFFKKCFVPEILRFVQKYQNIILSIEIGFVLTFAFRRHLLGFFAEKYLGVKCDNIDYRKFISPKEFVICFDDLERMICDSNNYILPTNNNEKLTSGHNTEALLAFCDTLREQGFSVLIICNSAEICESILSKYKEKVISKCFSYTIQDENLKNILHESKLTIKEQRFIKELLEGLIHYLPDAYNDAEKVMTEKLINLRFVIMLKDKLEMLMKSSLYKKAEKKDTLFPAVALFCSLQHLHKDKLNSDIYKHKKSLIRIFGIQYSYGIPKALSDFISDGTEIPDLKKILYIDQYTRIEKSLLNVPLWDYSTNDLKDCLDEVEHLCKKQSKTFSCLGNAQNFLSAYSQLVTECKGNFYNYSPDTILKRFFEFIDKQPLETLIDISFDFFDDGFIPDIGLNENLSENIKYLNSEIQKHCLGTVCKYALTRYSVDALLDNMIFYQNNNNFDMIIKYIMFCHLASDRKEIEKLINKLNSDYKTLKNGTALIIKLAGHSFQNSKIVPKYFGLDSLYPFWYLFKELEEMLSSIVSSTQDNRMKNVAETTLIKISNFIRQE